jgi:hypothetical protein
LGVALHIATSLTSAGSREAILASWAHRFERAGKRGPGARAARHHAAIAEGLLESLAVALAHDPPETTPGAPALRDLEKAAVFAGATWAVDGGNGFEVAAILSTLRDAVLEHADLESTPPLTELFEWLVVLALDAYATAGKRAVAERAAEQLDAGTPVLLLTPELPAVLLVGAPTEDVLDGILARAMLLVVRVGAPSLLLDVSGVAESAAKAVDVAVRRLFEHRRMSTVELVVIGAAADVADRWQGAARAHKVATRNFERFDDAFAHAASRAGINLVRRGT